MKDKKTVILIVIIILLLIGISYGIYFLMKPKKIDGFDPLPQAVSNGVSDVNDIPDTFRDPNYQVSTSVEESDDFDIEAAIEEDLTNNTLYTPDIREDELPSEFTFILFLYLSGVELNYGYDEYFTEDLLNRRQEYLTTNASDSNYTLVVSSYEEKYIGFVTDKGYVRVNFTLNDAFQFDSITLTKVAESDDKSQQVLDELVPYDETQEYDDEA